jgi:predicted DCC family thiol-disulfide oxidoreductase YuxK
MEGPAPIQVYDAPDGPEMAPGEGKGIVALFDGDCGVCSRSSRFFGRRDLHGRIERQDLRDPVAAARFPGLDPDAVRASMHAVRADGTVVIGLDAVREVIAELPTPWPWLAALLGLPGIHALARLGYRAFARNRLLFNRLVSPVGNDAAPACDGDACAIDWEALARSEEAHRAG